MPEKRCLQEQKNSRILMLSQRNLHDHVSRCGGYEFEDVICQSDSVDVFAPLNSYELSQNVFKVIKYITRSSDLASRLQPDPNPVKLDREYDLFFVLCASLWDVLAVHSIKNWREKCRKSVCYVDEIWQRDIYRWKPILELLKDFDYVFLTYNGSVQEVGEIVGRPCSYLPPASDAIRFSPYPNPPDRCIDIYNMGRRSPITHKALLNYSDTNNLFYYYDTPKSFSVIKPKEHRLLLSNLIKRSRYFLVNKAKVDQPEQAGTQVEIGNRFFEGIAGGAILLGEAISTEVFNQYLGWQDAVIPIPYDCPDIADIIADLEAQPMRLAKTSRDNAVNSLLRHDWVYRWEQILTVVQLEPAPALLQRQTHLKHLAEKVSIEFAASLN